MRIKIVALCVALCCVAYPQSISLHTENDAYFKPLNNDRYYTAGHNITYTSNVFSESFLRHVGFLSFMQDSVLSTFSLRINQEIYTPEDRDSAIPPKDDALYSGYLYGNIGIQNYTNDFFESVSLDIGVVGKASLARQVQSNMHIITHNNISRGWDSQIKNEMIINLYYKFLYRYSFIQDSIELLPYGEIALGNAYAHVGFGVNLRMGWGLSHDFRITQVRSSNVGSASLGDEFRFYIVAGINEKIVGRNIFLQGNTFGGVKSSLHINRFVYEASIGALMGYNGWSISYLFVYRQKEFTTQIAPHSYGAIRLEIGF